MILENKQTVVAYRCPHCGAGIMSAVNPFTLRGSMVRLKCDCGKSHMEIAPIKDGQVRLTVPCIVCPQPHHFTVNTSLFFNGELFSLSCPYSDIGLCVKGEMNHVKAELARSELELLDMMEKAGVTELSALHEEAEETISDPQVLDIVLFVIKDLDAEGKIFCRCHPDEEREYDAEVLPSGVRVTCKKCGATKTVPADSLVAAHDFLNCSSLELE